MSECTCDKFVVTDDMPIFVLVDGCIVDGALSTMSTNPVQNAVIATAIADIQTEIEGIDNTPITNAQIDALF